MGRLRNIFANACAPLLALSALCLAIWVGSYSRALEMRIPARVGGTAASCSIYRGIIGINYVENAPAVRRGSVRIFEGADTLRAARWDQLWWTGSYAGFSAADGTVWLSDADEQSVSRIYRSMGFPLWAIFAACVAVPLARGRECWQMRRRAAVGHCPSCNYDLGGLQIDCPACAARATIIGGTHRLQPIVG